MISGMFPRPETKLFQTDVDEGWNNFEIILFLHVTTALLSLLHILFCIVFYCVYVAKQQHQRTRDLMMTMMHQSTWRPIIYSSVMLNLSTMTTMSVKLEQLTTHPDYKVVRPHSLYNVTTALLLSLFDLLWICCVTKYLLNVVGSHQKR